nr:bifunctional phosphopantothenoylcysteine decarboxylase/phosphopantothenate--cysteine ligase CoaBC [Anaerolineae bacterium]
FEAITGRPVYTSMWRPAEGADLGTHIAHVGLGHQAELVVIAPATAHTIARIAHGLADDLLSVTILAAGCPVLIVPAMDAGMYSNLATRANIDLLRSRGVLFAGPTTGRMASGLTGLGRMIEPEEIVGHIRQVLGKDGPLRGKRLVVTAGPTREAFDPVRFITNRSTGKQGFAIAQAGVDLGAEVTLVAGPTELDTPVGVRRIDVVHARQMEEEVLRLSSNNPPPDALIMCAAAADYRPSTVDEHKIKKEHAETLSLNLVQNPDILQSVSDQPVRPHLVIGFAAETRNLAANAQSKLQRKNLDLIVANNVLAEESGFARDTNRVMLISRDEIIDLPLLSKYDVAVHILEWVAQKLAGSPE